MKGRGALAALILVAWVAALGWQARRVFFPAEAQRLALGVSTIPPGVAYYSVFRSGVRAGWGQTEIDTLPSASGFRVRDRVFLDLPGLGATGRSERSSEEYLDSGLNLDSMVHLSIVDGDTTRLRAVSEGDSVILLFDEQVRTVERVSVGEAVTTPSGWRLRLAAAGQSEPGTTYQVRVFDPLAVAVRTLQLDILETSSLTFPDSADTDSISGAWISVSEDTVQAWLVRRRAGDVRQEAWVDEDGRLVDGEIFGGLRVERTAFELAFFNRPGAIARPEAVSDSISAGERE